jgi:hypothetical protein
MMTVLIPALASIFGAVLAGFFAWRTRRADAEAQRVRDLESRISDRKYAVYEPMINLWGEILTPKPDKQASKPGASEAKQAEMLSKVSDFATWISIYGSDDAIQVFHNFMQAVYHGAPAAITLRLYADFMMAARKDMGYSETTTQREHLLGMRITDIYDLPDIIDPSFEEVCDRLGWQAPWLSSNIAPHQPD